MPYQLVFLWHSGVSLPCQGFEVLQIRLISCACDYLCRKCQSGGCLSLLEPPVPCGDQICGFAALEHELLYSSVTPNVVKNYQAPA